MAMFKDTIQDLKAFGGSPIFLFLVAISFLLQETLLSIQLVTGYVLSFALTAVIRAAYFRERPSRRQHRTWLEKIDASSFPSLHAMRASVLAVIFGVFFNNMLATVLFMLTAVGVAVVRVKQKRHFVSDVIVGFLLGIGVGFLALWVVSSSGRFI